MVAELEAEKNICQIKRNALQIATDEISKANSIIVRQSKEIIELRKKVDWRTEVALQQERTVKDVEIENIALKQKLLDLDLAIKENKDIADKFKELHCKADHIEDKYNKSKMILSVIVEFTDFTFILFSEINDLKNQLQQHSAESILNKNTKRYLQISNRLD